MPSERPDTPLVIGVGNRDRGDDGIGPAVVDELRRRATAAATAVREGDLADLAVLWRDHPHVVIVDACSTGRPVGTVCRLDPAQAAPGTRWSTHGVGLPDAIALAERLGRMPARLEVLGVEGREFEHGPMSAPLVDALRQIVDEIESSLARPPGSALSRAAGTARPDDGWHPAPARPRSRARGDAQRRRANPANRPG